MFARIDPAAAVFTLVSTFHTSPDRQAAIVESLTRFTMTARDLPGFVGTSVHASFDGTCVVNGQRPCAERCQGLVSKQNADRSNVR